MKTSLRWQFDEFEVDIRDSSHCHDEVYIFTDTETKGPFCGFDDAFANADRPVSEIIFILFIFIFQQIVLYYIR